MLTPVVALAVDSVLGEPPDRVHPVAWFGRVARRLERRSYADSVTVGAMHTAVLVGAAWGLGVVIRRVAGRPVGDVVATSMSVAGSMLVAEVASVADALDIGDLRLARHRVGRIVGRETDSLDPSDVARAAVETLAENTVDAVTAPLLFAAVGGAPAVLAHRAVNTLDAMIGHRDERYERFGKVAARLDDVAAWMPARLTACGVAAARPRQWRVIVDTVRRDAGSHPSPNGGVIEAAFAGALGVRLGGANRYGSVLEDRGTLGDGHPPTSSDIRRAIRLARRLWWTTAGALAAVGIVVRLSPRPSRGRHR